jgi:hypothetical protein
VVPFKDLEVSTTATDIRDDIEQFYYPLHTHLSGCGDQVSGQASQVVGGEGHRDVRLVRQQVLLLA